MRAPSNRSGIPTGPVILLVAVILFLGLSLGPRTFEFRAWPEASRQGAIEALVDRPAEPATEVPVARARVSKQKDEPLDVRGRNARKQGDAREARAGRREALRSAASRHGRGRDRGDRTPSVPPAVVETPAAPAPEAPVPAPEQPAQLAEGPSNDQVLRPEAEELLPEQRPAPLSDVPNGSRGRRGDRDDDRGDGNGCGEGDADGNGRGHGDSSD